MYGDSERWYCFGCGQGGGALDFVQRVENLSLPDAIQRLGGGSGPMPRAATSSKAPVAPQRPSAIVVPQRDPMLLTAAARFYLRSMLRSAEAREYLASRVLSISENGTAISSPEPPRLGPDWQDILPAVGAPSSKSTGPTGPRAADWVGVTL